MRRTFVHDLGAEGARAALTRAFAYYRDRHPDRDLELTWRDDRHAELRLRIMGARLRATVTLGEQVLEADVAVPAVLRPFRRLALAAVEREVDRWLADARRL